jgi:hypothetical protein
VLAGRSDAAVSLSHSFMPEVKGNCRTTVETRGFKGELAQTQNSVVETVLQNKMRALHFDRTTDYHSEATH